MGERMRRCRDEKGRTPGDLAESNPGLKGTVAYRRLKEAQ